MRKAVIVIPTYNESENVGPLIKKIFETTKNLENWQVEALIVDSTSPDKTAEKVKELQKQYKQLHLLKMGKEGLGRAYIKGFKFAIERLSPFLLFEMDADLSHNPDLIPAFLKKIEEGSDIVIGSRYLKGGSIPRNWGLHRKLFSVIGNLIIRFGFMKPKINDWTSGYRAIKTWVIKDVLPSVEKYSGYVFQVAFLDEALKKGAKVSGVPLNFVDRTYGKSKIKAGSFIIQTLTYVFTNSSFIRYAFVGLSGAIIDFGISFIIIHHFHIAHSLFWLATLISAEIAVIWNFFLNNSWSFSHKKLQSKPSVYLPQFFKFNLIAVGGLLIQAVSIQLLTNFFGPQYWYIYKFFILALIIIPYSYILYNKVVWKEKK